MNRASIGLSSVPSGPVAAHSLTRRERSLAVGVAWCMVHYAKTQNGDGGHRRGPTGPATPTDSGRTMLSAMSAMQLPVPGRALDVS